MTITSILILAFIASASCLSYSSQSKPFRLFLQSSNTTLSGTALAACHQGAAIEGLCITKHRASDAAVEYTTFYHNVSSTVGANAIDTLGVVGWTLKVNGGTLSVPSSLSIHTDLFSDVASPTFQTGESDVGNVAFDANGIMYLSPTLNDLVVPPENFARPMRLESWYVCLTRYSSYTYWTLNWQVGMNSLKPQNPSCVDVQVKRVFL